MIKIRNIYVLSDMIDVSSAPEEIKILPYGDVKSRKGPFKVDKESYDLIFQYFTERGLDIVIDYEHQTLDGMQAPAAGWIKNLSYKINDGIYAIVEWTEKAKEYLKNKEYRYLSPVILKRKEDGRAVQLHSVGLTNTPAIDGMEAIINKLDDGGNKMDLKEIAKALGLAEDATIEQILEAIQTINANVSSKAMKDEEKTVACKEVLEALELKEDATVAEVKGKIITLKNPAGYVSTEEFMKLKATIEKKEGNDLVQIALSEGKITPAQKEWAEQTALKDPEGFKSFLKTAPAVVDLKEINYKKEEKKPNSELELSINKMLGISTEDVKKYGGEK